MPVLLQVFFGGILKITGGNEEQHVWRFGLGPRESVLKFGWRNRLTLMPAVNKPDVGEAGAIHIFALLVGDNVSATIQGIQAQLLQSQTGHRGR